MRPDSVGGQPEGMEPLSPATLLNTGAHPTRDVSVPEPGRMQRPPLTPLESRP